jgi:hypothetical protein
MKSSLPVPTLDPLLRKKPALTPEKLREKRSISIGVICTVLFHVLLLCIAPFFPAEKFTGSHSNLDALRQAQRPDFNFELEPLTAEEQAQNAPFRFVETNPDAPDNAPDKTINVSDRNQQSAQLEKPTEVDPENRPSTKGRDDVQGGAIVSGNRAPPQPGAAAVPLEQALEEMVPQTAQQEQAQRAEQVPLSGFEKITGDNPDGVGTNVSQQKAPSTGAETFQEGARDVPDVAGSAAQPQQPQQPKMTPRQRPRLASASTARQSPISNRLAGTMNVGPVGIDARWSEFGQYMAQLIETVDGHFQRITSEYRGHIPAGTRVVVTFTLNSDGEVKVTQVEETAGRVAVSQCQSSITSGMPYPKWSREMMAVLGDQQTITFSFYYY